MKVKSSIVAQGGGRVSPDLLTHGHGSRLSVSVELHGLHGHGSFTAEGTLVQDGVKHLAGVKYTRFNTRSSQTLCFFQILYFPVNTRWLPATQWAPSHPGHCSMTAAE